MFVRAALLLTRVMRVGFSLGEEEGVYEEDECWRESDDVGFRLEKLRLGLRACERGGV